MFRTDREGPLYWVQSSLDGEASNEGASRAPRAPARGAAFAWIDFDLTRYAPAMDHAQLASLSDHAAENRRHWNADAANWVASGERNWAQSEPTWGIWGVPERELGLFDGLEPGMRAIELGCGTGYVSSWMARRGAVCTGVDVSEAQLATASRLAAEHGVDLTLHHGSAEATPYPDGSFDFAISEYGAAIWCDPFVWLREAHRLLRAGGRLAFLGNHPLATVCSPWDGAPVGETLVRPYFELHRTDWTQVAVDPGGIEFTLPFEGWFALFREVGFEVLDVREPRASRDDFGQHFAVHASWARRWPSELAWKLRKAP